MHENLHAAGRWRDEWDTSQWEVCGTPANAGVEVDEWGDIRDVPHVEFYSDPLRVLPRNGRGHSVKP